MSSILHRGCSRGLCSPLNRMADTIHSGKDSGGPHPSRWPEFGAPRSILLFVILSLSYNTHSCTKACRERERESLFYEKHRWIFKGQQAPEIKAICASLAGGLKKTNPFYYKQTLSQKQELSSLKTDLVFQLGCPHCNEWDAQILQPELAWNGESIKIESVSLLTINRTVLHYRLMLGTSYLFSSIFTTEC